MRARLIAYENMRTMLELEWQFGDVGDRSQRVSHHAVLPAREGSNEKQLCAVPKSQMQVIHTYENGRAILLATSAN